MKLNDMKDKLHAFLFPRYQRKVRNIVAEARKHQKISVELKERSERFKKINDDNYLYIKTLTKKIEDLEVIPELKPTMADLMREILGAPVNFTDVESDGLPKHFLESGTEKQKDIYIGQLNQIAQLEVWKAMVDYYINFHGNHLVRLALDDVQESFNRGTLNGFSLLRNEVKNGSAEYIDRSKPPDKFDKFSVELAQADLDD